jgi:hypothetical protein
MWASVFTIAVAASICLSVVNLASEINKIQVVRHSPVIEYSTPSGAPPSERPTKAGGSATEKNAPDPGA